LQENLEQKKERHIWRRGGTTRVVAVHVVEDVVDLREEVVIGEEVVGVQNVRGEEEVSSHAVALPKNLIALLPYRTRRSGVPEAYCPGLQCTPQDGMGKT
jgi:hypothetical protein